MASERIDYEMVLTKHHCVKEIQDLHLKHYLQILCYYYWGLKNSKKYWIKFRSLFIVHIK